EALFSRMVDDALYQSVVRAQVRGRLTDPSPFDLGEQRAQAESLVADAMLPKMRGLWEAQFAHLGYRLKPGEPHLAWPRLFTGVFPL
ncbi:DUF4127 family protein, partial [Deinococcus pimensis]|uniref:DUF4127 family protein n=1 Tax=Deinococcus pimensis TaxID=309888 RepID=UPI0005EB92CE